MTTLSRTCCVVALAVALAGCTASTRFASTKAKDANPSPKRMFVASHLLDTRSGANYGANFADGFDARLAEAFKACGTEIMVKNATGHDLDDDGLAAQLERFKPDTMLVIRKTHGLVNQYGGLMNVTYGFDLLEVPPKGAAKPGKDAPLKTVWRSTMDFKPGDIMLFPWKTQGASVADDLAKRMQDDGFFPGCTLPRAKEAAAKAAAEES